MYLISSLTITDPDNLRTGTEAVNSGVYTSNEVTVDAVNKEFWFKNAGSFLYGGSGVTGQALYSFFKDIWIDFPALAQYDFPMLSITNEQFEFIDGWKPIDTTEGTDPTDRTVIQSAHPDHTGNSGNTTTRKMIRTAGWAETDGTIVYRRFFGLVTLGTMVDETVDQPYFAQDSSYLTTNVSNTWYTGPANEAIKFYEDTNGDGTPDFDYKGYFKIYVRTWGTIFGDSSLGDIGVSELTYITYRFPLTNSVDLNTTGDNAITTGTIDTTITAIDLTYIQAYVVGTSSTDTRSTTWASGVVYDAGDVVLYSTDGRYYYTAAGGTDTATFGDTVIWQLFDVATLGDAGGERTVESDTSYSVYTTIIDANNVGVTPGYTALEVYQWAQRQLVKTDTDGPIDTGALHYGYVSDTLVYFVGSILHTSDGVFVDDIAAADENSIVFHDSLGATHLYPLTVTVTINFNTNLAIDQDALTGGDQQSKFYLYYTDINIESATSGNTLTIVGDSGYAQNALVGRVVTFIGGANDTIVRNITANTAYQSGTNNWTITVDGLALATETNTIDISNDEFGTIGALQVADKDGNDAGSLISNNIPLETVAGNGSSYSFNYAYTQDTTGGRKGGTPVSFTVIGIGTGKAQYVAANGTIDSTTGGASLVAPLERNYSNPA